MRGIEDACDNILAILEKHTILKLTINIGFQIIRCCNFSDAETVSQGNI